ncbi:conserved hypothetical protein [Polaromonas naphthalenivorans CJ2]|uniref:DUF2779 domain-containing protein n=2 Tax=Polaromonas naphthalenivorans TaxID=216465 RepID=A1VNX7_POLNA|nr:conserved hypothetical protein [Polaromonas naphthalenivorans CJ2]
MRMAFTPLLNHDDLQRWRACSRRFWLHRRGGPAAVSQPSATGAGRTARDADETAEAAVVHGPGLQAALRASFPRADLIAAPGTPAEWAAAVQQTLDCLDSDRVAPEGWAILGACLTSDDRAQVRIDVLTCGEQGLRLFKVRYATVGDEADVDAVALWVHAAARCGLRVQSAGLLLVDTGFIYPGHGCYAGLFREVDLASVLGSRPVAAWLSAMRTCDRGPEPPATPGAQCTQSGGCEFASHCQAGEPASSLPAPDPQASLDIVGRELAAELRQEGHADLRSVALQRLGNLRHRRAARAIQQGGPVLEPAVAALMQALPYPRYSLRFDTIGFAVPLWAGTRPYQVLPFQWTCGVQSAAGQWAQQGFLADADGGDPRRAFALTLLQALGSAGPVLAYNAGFERSRLRELAQQFDDLAPALDAVQARIVDLFQLARAHYYHPVMAGSWSFKSISRAVAPDVPVARLEDVQASSAQAAFARSLQRGLEGAARQQLRAALQAHGQRETEVLRRMAALFEAGAAEAAGIRH